MPRESTLQAAMDLHSAHETLARVKDALLNPSIRCYETVEQISQILEDRHPWLFTDASSPTQNTAELETMESYYARRLGYPKVHTEPHDR